jgi:putative chitinase
MIQISTDQLAAIMPSLPANKCEDYLPHLLRAMERFHIDSAKRAAAFLAQIAHESGELKYWEEIWGPTPQQRKYEPPSEVATRLGNTKVGDGFLYRGRGPLQLTGRANYKRFGEALGMNLIENPEWVAIPRVGFETSAFFWSSNRLNALADLGAFETITVRINGGTKGLKQRLAYFKMAKNVLKD